MRYVIELGKALPDLPDSENIRREQGAGLREPGLALGVRPGPDGTPSLRFRGDSDAHIVRGLIAILMRLYSGHTPAEILAAEPRAVFAKLGLDEHLTPQRSNGLYSMVARIEADAKAHLQPAGS